MTQEQNFGDLQCIYQVLIVFSNIYSQLADIDPSSERKEHWNDLNTIIIDDLEQIHECWSLICAESEYGIPYPDQSRAYADMKKLIKRAEWILKTLHPWSRNNKYPKVLLRLEHYYVVQMKEFIQNYPEDSDVFIRLIDHSSDRSEIIYKNLKDSNFYRHLQEFLMKRNMKMTVSL
ncbi:MAG: hypothetical protein H6618_05245 [Deltaproteobacteria bacterium]|nr:hypothetical protein [Deltaproteobacteria bacterium]